MLQNKIFSSPISSYLILSYLTSYLSYADRASTYVVIVSTEDSHRANNNEQPSHANGENFGLSAQLRFTTEVG